MYPKNNATPPRIAVGAIYTIATGAAVVADASVVVRAEGGDEAAGGGTLAVGATSGVWYYTPTQAETNYTAFTVTVYKADCTKASVTVVTSASPTPGIAVVADTQKVDVHTIKTQTVTCAAGVTVGAYVGGTGAAALETTAQSVKTKTDGLNFNGTDVKATLDGEEVTPTAASKTGYTLAADQSGVTIGTVTTLTNLPAITTDWLTAAGVSAGAVTKIQAGLSTYDGSDTPGTGTLLSRVLGTIAAGTHQPNSGDSYAVVTSATHGNAALKTLIDGIEGGGLDEAGVRDAIGLPEADLGDRLDAITVAIAGISGGEGGDFKQTVTVTDGTNAIPNASVRIFSGGVLISSDTSDANGLAEVYADSGVGYELRTSATGYAVATRTFDVAADATLADVELTAHAPPAPSAIPNTVTAYGYCYAGSTAPEASVTIYLQQLTAGTQQIYDDEERALTSQAGTGLVTATVWADGSTYRVKRGAKGIWSDSFAPAEDVEGGGTFLLPGMLGHE